MTAYDYDRQKWVDGPEAVRVRLSQVRADIAILKSPAGPEFARYLSLNRRATLRARCRELRNLESAPPGDILSADANHVHYAVS